MPRIRTIKPDFYVDERIADLSYPAAFHFPGLWLLADRAGRLLDRPREIKAKIAPLRDVDMEAVLVELEAAKMVLRYVVNDEKYLEVCNLERHQHFNTREPPSMLPPPNTPSVARERMHARARTCTHVHAPGEGKGMEGNGREGSLPVIRRVTEFTEFWAAYPRKVGKGAAERAWEKQHPPLAAVLTALAWQRYDPEWLKDRGQFIPHPATYLAARRWEDEPNTAPIVSETTAHNLAAGAAWLRRSHDGD